MVVVETNAIGEEVEFIKIAKLSEHNHVCNEARVVKWLLHSELVRNAERCFYKKHLM